MICKIQTRLTGMFLGYFGLADVYWAVDCARGSQVAQLLGNFVIVFYGIVWRFVVTRRRTGD